MKLVVVASDHMEFRGFYGQSPVVPIPVDWARVARLNGHEMLLVSNGVGARRAAAAVDAAISFQPDAIVSTGFCGALDPALGIGDVVVASCVVSGDRRYPASGTGTSVIVSVDHVVQTADEKCRLFATGAAAVEMEASGVAERAESLHLPFYCVKAVTDLAGEDMANDFNRALTSDGHFDTMVLLGGTFGRPLVRIRELLRLRKRCVRACRALGEFFADCRF